jgi:hypothetical protein
MAGSIERFVGNCVVVRSQVLDGNQAVDTLKVGTTYGHDLTAMNEALWTLDVFVQSESDDPRQIAYTRSRKPKEWILAITLQPAEERTTLEILGCIKRTSGKNTIRSEVLLSNNLSDKLALKLKVE